VLAGCLADILHMATVCCNSTSPAAYWLHVSQALTWQHVSRLAGRFAALVLNSVPSGQGKRRPGLVTGSVLPHVTCKASGRCILHQIVRQHLQTGEPKTLQKFVYYGKQGQHR
jgi:hypothetical protein